MDGTCLHAATKITTAILYSCLLTVSAVKVDKSLHAEYHFLISRPLQRKLSCILRGTKTISMELKHTWKILVASQHLKSLFVKVKGELTAF